MTWLHCWQVPLWTKCQSLPVPQCHPYLLMTWLHCWQVPLSPCEQSANPYQYLNAIHTCWWPGYTVDKSPCPPVNKVPIPTSTSMPSIPADDLATLLTSPPVPLWTKCQSLPVPQCHPYLLMTWLHCWQVPLSPCEQSANPYQYLNAIHTCWWPGYTVDKSPCPPVNKVPIPTSTSMPSIPADDLATLLTSPPVPLWTKCQSLPVPQCHPYLLMTWLHCWQTPCPPVKKSANPYQYLNVIPADVLTTLLTTPLSPCELTTKCLPCSPNPYQYLNAISADALATLSTNPPGPCELSAFPVSPNPYQ